MKHARHFISCMITRSLECPFFFPFLPRTKWTRFFYAFDHLFDMSRDSAQTGNDFAFEVDYNSSEVDHRESAKLALTSVFFHNYILKRI